MAYSKKDVAGMVTLYNSLSDVIENIATYQNQVSKLYIIDNSDVVNSELVDYFHSIPSIEYIANLGNLGIANALNKAAHQAIHDGFTYLLTMDDDSKAPANIIEVMLSFLDKYRHVDQLGILSIAHNNHKKYSFYEQVNLTMTSGNLLNLKAYSIVGDFNNELFIDHVDHEYNLRLHLNGFHIIELSKLKLIHNLGTTKMISFFNKNVAYSSHSPLRLYYFTRSAVYIVRKYYFIKPEFCFTILWLVIKELIKFIFFDNDKQLRISYILKAIRSGGLGELGKLNLSSDK